MAVVVLMSSAAPVSPEAVRDVSSYAVASCYSLMPEYEVQARIWAGAIIERGHGPLEPWKTLSAEVARSISETGVGRAKPEGPGMPSPSTPLMTCGEIGGVPSVAAAIRRVLVEVSPHYPGSVR